MKYLIYAQFNFEIETEDEIKAKEESENCFKKLEEAGKEFNIKVENARVADIKSGYFLTK